MPRPAVVVEPVDGLPQDPLRVLRALAHLAGTRRLTVVSGRWSDAGFVLAADPVEVVEATVADLADVDELAALLERTGPLPGEDTARSGGAVGGGWSVVLGHALGRLTGRVRTTPPPVTPPRLPDLVLARYTHLLRHDGESWWAEALDEGDGVAAAAARALATEAVTACAGPPAGPPEPAVRLLSAPSATAHMAAVEHVVTAVRAGEIAQANVCGRFALALEDGGPAAVLAWARLVDGLHPERAALVTGPWGALVGASPETYLSVAGGRVSSSPIKGTRPAGEARALAESAKDASENVMIVDLVRNDLAHVCEAGSVTVDELLSVRPHAGVSHLVSRVSGRLRAGVGPGSLVVGTFPPGSVIGTPKQRAGEVTDREEQAARGAHTGAVGFLAPGLCDLAVSIRTLEVGTDGTAALGVGGGVVADSTPAEEWHEVLTKAAPLLRALGVPPVLPAPSTAAHKGGADPSSGLIETVLAVDGRVVEAADHVARLRRSVWELTGRGLETDVGALLARAAEDAGRGAHRLRLRVRLPGPGGAGHERAPQQDTWPQRAGRPTAGAGPEATVEVGPWHRPTSPEGRRGLVLGVTDAPAHGLERHKYADRRALDTALAEAGPVDDVAFRAADGLLETSRACLLAVVTGPTGAPGLVTPACDGRILAGTTRQVLVDLALARGWSVRLGPLDDDLLAAADGLVAANALRGAQWVAAVGPHRWHVPAPALVELAEALLHRWRLADG